MNKKYFTKRSDLISLSIVATHLILVFLPIYLAAILPLGYYTVLFYLIFGLSMNGILNLMHECSHYHVFKHKKYSELLGKYIIAPLVFTDFEMYRQRHWDHHRFLGMEGETKDAYLIDIKGKNIFLLFIRCIFMIEAVNKFSKQIEKNHDRRVDDKRWILNVLIVQSIYFSSILLVVVLFSNSNLRDMLLKVSIAYAVVYLYALMSLTVFMADLRAIAEHQIFNSKDIVKGYASLRNFRCNIISRWLMGAYGFVEHYTHHKIPGIPYYHLKKVTDELAKNDSTYQSSTGYFSILSRIIKDK